LEGDLPCAQLRTPHSEEQERTSSVRIDEWSTEKSARRSAFWRDLPVDPDVLGRQVTFASRLRVISAVAVVAVGFAAVGFVAGARSGPRLPQPLRLTPAPKYVLRLCRTSGVLAPACPSRIPFITHLRGERAYDLVSLCRPRMRGCAGVSWDDFNIGASGNGDRPPLWLHLAIFAGRLTGTRAFPFHYPTRGRAVGLMNGLFAQARTRALFLGRVRWGNRTGTLVLAPGYPTGGQQGDHLIFHWSHGPVEYALGLHGWEPFLQTVSTLRAIVRSIPQS